MVELTVGDLLRWKSSQLHLAGPWDEQSEALESEFSWAVCIRATPPVLPTVRGKELVIVPSSILRDLERQESISWNDVARHLRGLPIAAIVTDDPRFITNRAGQLVIEVVAANPELETDLNREFTERRGELYQLGTDLARTLSAASIGGSELDSFLKLATRRTASSLALMTLTGRVLATSDPKMTVPVRVLSFEDAGFRISLGGLDWISQPVSGRGLPEGVVLVAALDPADPADRARLTLEQTSEALGLMFDRLPPIDAPDPQREAAELLALLAESGSLPVAADRRLTRLAGRVDLESTLRVVAWIDEPGNPRIGPALSFEIENASLELVEANGIDDLREGRNSRLIVSRPFIGLDRMPAATAEVLAVVRLWRCGYIAVDGLDLQMPGIGGALVALLAAGALGGDAEQPLHDYARAMLDDLDRYDQARDMQLVATLGAFLDSGGVIATAANNLGIHRNTLAYRIGRIADVSGHDLSDPSTRFNLQLAIAVRRLQSV